MNISKNIFTHNFARLNINPWYIQADFEERLERMFHEQFHKLNFSQQLLEVSFWTSFLPFETHCTQNFRNLLLNISNSKLTCIFMTNLQLLYEKSEVQSYISSTLEHRSDNINLFRKNMCHFSSTRSFFSPHFIFNSSTDISFQLFSS